MQTKGQRDRSSVRGFVDAPVCNTVRSVWSEAALTLVQICGRGVVAGEGTVRKVSCVLGVHQMQKMILRGTHGACRPMRLHRPGPGYRTVEKEPLPS